MAWINLGRVLQKKGWSSTRFASELRIPPNRVSRYYREGFDPPFSTILRWAEVLDVSVQDPYRHKFEGQADTATTNHHRCHSSFGHQTEREGEDEVIKLNCSDEGKLERGSHPPFQAASCVFANTPPRVSKKSTSHPPPSSFHVFG
ncbi:MAG: helix-turn-helix transcriptional regulator [Calothrix sp. SM1_5_4]|nr:helix-turn-helix transcriptional regulator [Calothrix sp. SM1_5_4]